jgi:SAM-dependent methyltransferase
VTEETADVRGLRGKLEAEARAYAEVLAAVDRLAAFPLPAEVLGELPARLERLNGAWQAAARPGGRGPAAELRKRAFDAVAPALHRQAEFNALVVQVLNETLGERARLEAHLRDFVQAVVRYMQKVEPLLDARARLSTAHATTRSELVLEAFDRRQESLARRLEGLAALRDRIEVLGEEVRALRGTLEAGAPPPAVAAAAVRAAKDAAYTAFENRYRGTPDEIRGRLARYLDLLAGLAPVVDLGCGRGELLELLRERGLAARGVEANAQAARECRDRGLDVVEGSLVDFLAGCGDGSLGAAVAIQVAEHLPAPVLTEMLAEAHRALRPGGLLLVETVNPRSLVGLLEVFNRDPTHERPLHPDTLRFLAAAAGFGEVRVELLSPVEPLQTLQEVPAEGLPPDAARVLNENVGRLNVLLYGHLEYVLVARR